MIQTVIKHYIINKFISSILDGFNNVFNSEKCRKINLGEKYREITFIRYFKHCDFNITESEIRCINCHVTNIDKDMYLVKCEGSEYIHTYLDENIARSDAETINSSGNSNIFAVAVYNKLNVNYYNSNVISVRDSEITEVT